MEPWYEVLFLRAHNPLSDLMILYKEVEYCISVPETCRTSEPFTGIGI
jgi:hypothetical protein